MCRRGCDHADIFADLAAIETQFHHLVRTVPSTGLVVSNGREETLQRVIQRGCWTPVEKFSSSPLPIVGEGQGERGWHINADNQIYFNGNSQGTLQWEVMGEHNRMNALAALAIPLFTHTLLLRAGRLLAAGPNKSVLTTARLAATFDTPLRLIHRRARYTLAIPLPS